MQQHVADITNYMLFHECLTELICLLLQSLSTIIIGTTCILNVESKTVHMGSHYSSNNTL